MAMAMAMPMRMWDQILMRTVGPRVERGEDLTDLTFRNLGALVDQPDQPSASGPATALLATSTCLRTSRPAVTSVAATLT
ncbi:MULTISPECIES: hypothetical protein [unclassified Streptomyces]|uniref:hypothetical protein n=1 Tax=unclassified Streptomyces TaxID=2593676 RepID=UPI0033C13189